MGTWIYILLKIIKNCMLKLIIKFMTIYRKRILRDNDGAVVVPTDEFGNFFGFNTKNFASPGYQKLPNGLIIQWGMFTGTGTTNFPIPFPNACLMVLSDGVWATNSNPPYKTLSAVENWTKTGFTRGTFGLIQTGNFNEALATHSYRTISPIANFGGQSRWIAIGF